MADVRKGGKHVKIGENFPSENIGLHQLGDPDKRRGEGVT